MQAKTTYLPGSNPSPSRLAMMCTRALMFCNDPTCCGEREGLAIQCGVIWGTYDMVWYRVWYGFVFAMYYYYYYYYYSIMLYV